MIQEVNLEQMLVLKKGDKYGRINKKIECKKYRYRNRF